MTYVIPERETTTTYTFRTQAVNDVGGMSGLYEIDLTTGAATMFADFGASAYTGFAASYAKLKHREWLSYTAHFSQWEKDTTLDI